MVARIAVPLESRPGERRVALVPEAVGRLVKGHVEVLVQAGAGTRAGYPDADYAAQGATIVASAADLASAGILLGVQPPDPALASKLPTGSLVVSLLYPSRNLELVRSLVGARLTVYALELLPRITRAQSMDVLSSQATIAGYQAAILGAELSPKLFPMLTTAAGTIRPSTVLVLGAGVAGLMAIATARRLGAVVEGYDVRRAAGEQVRSLGAKFLELQINAEGSGGYARELTPEEKAEEQKMLGDAVARADVVITTANVPGRKAPVLLPKEMVDRMKPGAVVVDLAAESGGNCILTKPDETVRARGVTIVGPTNLPSQVAYHASQMFSRNVQSFLGLLIGPDGALAPNDQDEILQASLVTRAGEVLNAPTRDLLGGPK